METKDAAAGRDPVPSDRVRLTPLGWPPPGLTRIEGDSYIATTWLAAGAILILPLLLAVAAEQDPWSLGPLGESIWLALLFGIVGIPVLLGGYLILVRLLWRSATAADQGHHWRVIALVAVDHRGDTGFLLEGAREYGLLTDGTRRRLATARIWVGGLLLFAALWLSLGFGIAVVAAARDRLSPWGVILTTLAPSIITALVAVVVFGWQGGILRRIRKKWYRRAWSLEQVREEIHGWQEAIAKQAPGVPEPGTIPAGGGRTGRVLRVAYVGVAVATIAAFVPVFTLIFSAAIIPTMARISVPELEETVARYASVEPLRSYALSPDTGITAQEAGHMLHTLSFVGRPYRATEGVRPPAREYPGPWFPATDTAGPPSNDWIRTAVSGIGEPIPAAQRAYLDIVATHPAHAEVARLARAPALDITSERWSLPLPSNITMAELSMPAIGGLREAGYAQLARAAVQAAEGRVAAADTTLRQLLTVGLLMADESPTVIDNLVGLGLVELAGDALVDLYRSTGYGDGDALAWGLESAARAAERARAPAVRNLAATLQAMPEQTLDDAFLRGVRWDYVGLLNTLGPCVNLRRVVFGPDAEYRAWLDRVEDELVRYPAEAELFEVARGGLLGPAPSGDLSLSARVLALTMGNPDEPGSCARILSEVVGF